MSLQQTEAECAANAKAPRVKLSDIEGAIEFRKDLNLAECIGATAGHTVLPSGKSDVAATRLMSMCVLVMRNGFVVVGKSAPASPENFNKELGQKLAYEDAVRQLWPLMGFALRDRLWRDTADAEAFHAATRE